MDDQLIFNQLVGTVWMTVPKGAHDRHRAFYPIKAASADGRVIFDGNGARALLFLSFLSSSFLSSSSCLFPLLYVLPSLF